jgi:acyl carrier protein
LARRLAEAPENDRERVAVEFVRREVASVLGHASPHEIDVQRAFNELGFDSLTAVELRNRLSAACDKQLPATLAFDYPSISALAGFLLTQVAPARGAVADAVAGSGEGAHDREESALRAAIAAIPLERLRRAGLVGTLLELAGIEDPSATAEREPAESVEEMDIDSLVELTLGGTQGERSPAAEQG